MATWKSAANNVPALTKSLLTCLILTSLFGAMYIYRQRLESDTPAPYAHCPFLGLVPGLLLYAPWTLVTSLFFENTLFSFVTSFAVLLFCGKYLERAWGSRELLKFILISGTVTNGVTWVGMIVTFYLTGQDSYLYESQINGMAGVFAAFLVAFKYLVPEHRLSLFGGIFSMRVKHLIGIATAASIVGLVLFQAIVFYNLVNIGWVVGWIYIRFFRVQDGIQGDQSEAFALVTFFPDFLHPVIGFVANNVHHLFVRLHLCPPFGRHQQQTMYDMESTHHRPAPGSARAEAERRRALALRALDMRLSKPAANAAPAAQSTVATATPTAAHTTQTTSAPTAKSDATEQKDTVLFDATEAVKET
ncbi:eukaryotic integral membrane protein-domain-containing protein [Gongronella butleri]|nr:eukaryotic integral membrane protein-domain-containing protein [Gongronella butleri]